MADILKCKLCRTRRPRRFCPGVRGDICAACCGAEREVSVDCPLDCEYLREARLHDRPPEVNPDQFPNQDVRVTETFLRQHQEVVILLSRTVALAAHATAGAVDFDVREALESLIRTYRTLQSGLYYETKPENLVAGAIHQRVQEGVDQLRKDLSQGGGLQSIRDVEILGVLVFLQRMEISHNNGRKRGRAFLDFMRGYFPATQPSAAGSLLA